MLELARVAPAVLASREEQILQRMEAARTQLEAAKTIGDAKQVADAAAAVCEWLRRQRDVGLEIVNDGMLLQLQAERRMGEFLRRPGAVKTTGGPERSYSEDTVSPPTYTNLGIKRVAAQQYRQVAEVPAETLEDLAEKATRRGQPFTRKSVLKVAQRLRPKPPPASAEETTEGPVARGSVILTGDARELAKQLPDASVAVCFCDPVYKNVADYEWLARECERVLIPGGNLVAQCGNMGRFDCEVAMRRSGLQYVDLLAEVYPYALCPLFPLRVQIGWKPYLWFSKGPRLGEWMMNRVHAGGKHCAETSKELHPWGDSEQFAAGVLEKLCRPGELVWDPFTGSGTVPAVAKRLGLPFIAFEIDADAAELARQRVAGTLKAEAAQGSLCLDVAP